MNYSVVTTCNREGWKQYGERMVTSFLKNWGSVVPLSVYVEGFKLPVYAPTLEVHGFNLIEKGLWLRDFKERNANRTPRDRMRAGVAADYIHDAVRFSHKVAAMIAESDRLRKEGKVDVMIWLDADTVTHSPVEMDWLDRIFPPGYTLGLLQRDNPKYSETGCIMFNLRDDALGWFLAALNAMYEADLIFTLDGWTDCHAIDHAAKCVEVKGCKVFDLSGPGHHTTHPFINGPLGQCMDHLKGDKRKKRGRSQVQDLRLRRTEEYWAR